MGGKCQGKAAGGVDDPVVRKTEWTPAKKGGANFKTRNLVRVNEQRLEFRASTQQVLVSLVFLLVGLGLFLGLPIYEWGLGGLDMGRKVLLLIPVGLLFFLVGAALLVSGMVPAVFDKGRNAFWRGKTGPGEAFERKGLKDYTEFHRIHAIQLVSEYCKGSKTSFYSYELNLVLDDGSRLNIVDHGDKDRLREDAKVLGAFLGKPMWDVI
ncbi:MAG: hypothetical protein AB1921_17695 [Thermodesulfobacteriota bacterium]